MKLEKLLNELENFADSTVISYEIIRDVVDVFVSPAYEDDTEEEAILQDFWLFLDNVEEACTKVKRFKNQEIYAAENFTMIVSC